MNNTKYIVLLCDGMADVPVDELGGKTPMEAAYKPNMDKLAEDSLLGMVRTVPEDMPPGSDVANLSVMGYDPSEFYTGRSPLEAASIGIELAKDDLAMRTNLVTLSDEPDYSDKTMIDYCSDDISTSDAKILIDYLKAHLDNDEFTLYTGISYRHCLVWHYGSLSETLTPPHDITDKKIKEYISGHKSCDKLYGIMLKSHELLKNHPLNIERVTKGKHPANSIWLWGQGKKPTLEPFTDKFGVKGSVISAVDLLKGIGICAGMSVPSVEGATGYIDTNFRGKAEKALYELKNGCDFVYIHIEAPDECGHRGETGLKVKSIELIDKEVLAPLLEGLEQYENYKILILPDHPTPLSIKTHTNKPVPFMLFEKNNQQKGNGQFCEKTCENKLFVNDGHKLMTALTGQMEFSDIRND